jgi:5-methylcytosine-specific restriction protein B
LRALSRLQEGRVWVKPDLLDISTPVPEPVTVHWPSIPPALKSYSHVIYAAVEVRPGSSDLSSIEDLLDLFFSEHGTPLTGGAAERWNQRKQDITSRIFPETSEEEVLSILNERRFVILEGPPGTGKTRLAYRIAGKIGSSSCIQFHAARTYEDFVVGLFPRPTDGGLAFDVCAGDLLRANALAKDRKHILVIDEINRAVSLPHTPEGYPEEMILSPHLLVLGTRNTADRTIAGMDIAIRRRFAFIEMWPDLNIVREAGIGLATDLFADTILTFAEYADEDTLCLVPGHAYFLDPRPDLDKAKSLGRVKRRILFELLPLLHTYLDEKMCGSASEAIAGLADRIEARIIGQE